MTNAKVVVPKEVAEAIESAKSIRSEEVIVNMSIAKSFVGEQAILNSVNPYTIVKMLLNGYEVEKSPEEKVREYYGRKRQRRNGLLCGIEREHLEVSMHTVQETLDLLGIKIEGVNA